MMMVHSMFRSLFGTSDNSFDDVPIEEADIPSTLFKNTQPLPNSHGTKRIYAPCPYPNGEELPLYRGRPLDAPHDPRRPIDTEIGHSRGPSYRGITDGYSQSPQHMFRNNNLRRSLHAPPAVRSSDASSVSLSNTNQPPPSLLFFSPIAQVASRQNETSVVDQRSENNSCEEIQFYSLPPQQENFFAISSEVNIEDSSFKTPEKCMNPVFLPEITRKELFVAPQQITPVPFPEEVFNFDILADDEPIVNFPQAQEEYPLSSEAIQSVNEALDFSAISSSEEEEEEEMMQVHTNMAFFCDAPVNIEINESEDSFGVEKIISMIRCCKCTKGLCFVAWRPTLKVTKDQIADYRQRGYKFTVSTIQLTSSTSDRIIWEPTWELISVLEKTMKSGIDEFIAKNAAKGCGKHYIIGMSHICECPISYKSQRNWEFR